MKIVVGSLQQETNTFSPTCSVFEDFDFFAGENVLGKIAATDVLLKAGVEIIPTIYANALPSGRLEEKSFNRLTNELIERIPTGEKIDGIWLYLHGAMEVENIGSGEVALLSEIRRKVGYEVPIAVALDFHANNSEKIAELANIICGYKTAPHTDMKETQIHAAQLLVKCINEKVLPYSVIVKIPAIIAGDTVITGEEPARSIIGELKKIEQDGSVLCGSLFNGQNWVDAPNNGPSVVITTCGSRNFALSEAKRIAKMYWDARREFRFRVEALDPEDAIEKAFSMNENPVFITDSGDNTTAGASGDNALFLKLLMEKKAYKTLVAGITDNQVVRYCDEYNTGDKIEFILGAGIDKIKSQSVQVSGVLKAKEIILGWDGEPAGKAVVVGIDGIDIIITEKRCALISPQIFKSVGVNIYDYKIIVVKQGYLYPELAKVSKYTILAKTPGASCVSVDKLEFHNIKLPVFPFDRDLNWCP